MERLCKLERGDSPEEVGIADAGRDSMFPDGLEE